MNIAVIPARGGSKRILRKNIKIFYGKPMLAWPILTALSSGLFARVIVSTDDEKIAEVAREWGAEVPFLRPAELADDHTGTTEVIAHATAWVMDNFTGVEAVCCIYATSPFINADDLLRGRNALDSGEWAYSFTVTDYPSPIFRSFKETADGGVEMFFPKHFSTRSQDLPAALHDAGQFYWGRPEAWLREKKVFASHSKPIKIPRWRVVDIDTEEDWRHAELLAKVLS